MSDAACSRCGTFSALTPVAGQQLCAQCIERLKAMPVYSQVAVRAVAILTNPTAGAAMLAMNHSALGNKARAREWTIAAVVIGVVYVILMNIDAIPNGAFLAGNVGAGIAMSRSWEPEWAMLAKLGFKKRNPWWVVLATLGALVVLVVVLTAVELARGEAPEL
jgi:hypothetical protein